MTAYLIKSILCLLVLWCFYKLALEQTAAHNIKRFYLLGSLVVALALPLVTFSYTVAIEPQPVNENVAFENFVFTDQVAVPVEEPINWMPIILGTVYAAGVLLFGFRFLRNLYRIREKVRTNEKISMRSHTNVLLAEKVIPHSFLQFIFLSKKEFKKELIAPEILQHEQAHVNQKHSWDILFIEFLQVVFWFNPLFIFIKKDIRLNHEFLADQAALSQNRNVEKYTNLLFNYSGGAHHTALSSPINYSLTKKRILMLSKTRSVKKLATRLALFVPVLACCMYFFNQEIVAKPQYTVKQNPEMNVFGIEYNEEVDSITMKKITARFKGKAFNGKKPTKEQIENWIKDGFKLSINSEIASPEDLNEYKASDFALYNGLRTIDTLSGKIVNAYVSLMTTEYYKASSKKQVLLDTVRHQEYPTLKIGVPNFIRKPNILLVNKKSVPFENFVNHIDSITSLWSSVEQMNYTLMTAFSPDAPQGNETYYEKINVEFKKTQIYQINPDKKIDIKLRQESPILNLKVKDESVWVNGEATSVANFTKTIDAVTKDWTKSDMMNYSIQVQTKNGVDKVISALSKEFRKTKLYKTNPSRELIPPPPPPAPAAPEGQLPAPPAPPSIPQTLTPPAPPSTPQIPIPADIINKLKENNGTAYYNGKKISYDVALSLMEKKKDLQILFNENKGKGNPDLIIKDN